MNTAEQFEFFLQENARKAANEAGTLAAKQVLPRFLTFLILLCIAKRQFLLIEYLRAKKQKVCPIISFDEEEIR
jgi:hypothetical protein